MSRIVALLLLLAAAATVPGFTQNRYGKPKTVLRVVVLYFRDTVSAEQRRAVYEGLEKLAAEAPGIRNLWLKPLRIQGRYEERSPEGAMRRAYPYTDAFVIEFESAEAMEKCFEHPAYKAWEAMYLPLRGRSLTYEIGN